MKLDEREYKYVLSTLENLVYWLKGKSVQTPFPNQFLNTQGGLRDHIGDPMEAFIAGFGRS